MRHKTDLVPDQPDETKMESPMIREYERLVRIWRLAEARRDLIAILVVQTRIGRLTQAFLEGAVARG